MSSAILYSLSKYIGTKFPLAKPGGSLNVEVTRYLWEHVVFLQTATKNAVLAFKVPRHLNVCEVHQYTRCVFINNTN